MEITHWYEWVMIYSYDVSIMIFIFSFWLYSRIIKNKYIYIVLFGFIFYFIGNVVMSYANIETTKVLIGGYGSAEYANMLWLVGRFLSSGGFFASSLGFGAYVLIVFKNKE